MTTPPSTGATCGPPTRSRARSPRSACGPASRRAPDRRPPRWRWPTSCWSQHRNAGDGSTATSSSPTCSMARSSRTASRSPRTTLRRRTRGSPPDHSSLPDPQHLTIARWAREAGDPLAVPIAAARATLLSDLGQLREALAMVQPLLQTPPDDPDTYAEALWAHCWALTAQGRTDEALISAERSVEVARSPAMRATAVSVRGLAHTFGGDFAAGARDSAEATA